MERFLILFRRQWLENQKTFWFATLVLLGTIALLYAYSIFSSAYFRTTVYDPVSFARFSSMNFRTGILTVTSAFYLCVYSGQYFSAFGKPNTSIQEIMLPVSSLARTICAFLLSTLVLIITSLFVCFLVDMLFVSGLRATFAEELLTFDKSAYVSYGSTPGFLYFYQTMAVKDFAGILWIGIVLSSCFTLGSIYFTKLGFLKTGLFLLLLIAVCSWSVALLRRLLWEDLIRVSSVRFEPTQDILMAIAILIIVSCWIAIYFRLQEKEI